MDLYFLPMACSMATRIAAYEAGAPMTFIAVDNKVTPKRTSDGEAFLTINPMGQVPVLRADDGELISENVVVLQYLADQFPASGLIPPGGAERRRVLTWLSFVSAELHAKTFAVLLGPSPSEEAKAVARASAVDRFAVLEAHLTGREFLQGQFSVADAYLFVMLVWSRYVGLDLAPYPALAAYRDRLQARPSVARAFGEEFTLFKAAA